MEKASNSTSETSGTTATTTTTGSLEEMIVENLEDLLVSRDYQMSLGIPEKFCTDYFYLVRQDEAKDLLACFLGNRFYTDKIFNFAVFGRLSLCGDNSQHEFIIWPGKLKNILFEVDIKVSKKDRTISPDSLLLQNMKRTDLCSNRYYLFILQPKLPTPPGVRKRRTDLHLVSAVEIEKCLAYQNTLFKDIPDFQQMVASNQEAMRDPRYLYTASDCEEMREELLRDQNERFPNFEEDPSSNELRNVNQNLIVFTMQKRNMQHSLEPLEDGEIREQDLGPQQPVLEALEEGEIREPESVDSNGVHFLHGHLNERRSESSFSHPSVYQPSFASTN